MFGTDKMAPAAAAAGLVVLAALVGCGREPSVASKSAAAFREAQKKGETFEGSGHSHGGHEAEPPDGGHESPGTETGHDEHAVSGAEHGAMEGTAASHSANERGDEHHAAAGHGPGRSAEHQAEGADHQGGDHGGHGGQLGMGHGQAATAEGGHAGHGATPPASPAAPDAHASHDAHGAHGAEPRPEASGDDHAGHAGHAPSSGGVLPETPSPAAKIPSPGQPASTLRPDALDSPAATSVADAQRSAEMAEGMAGGGHGGGHGAHGGTGTYRHVDAGRGPEASQGSDSDQHQHQGPATSAPAAQEGEHSHGASGSASTSGAPETTAAGYTCPMHPEVVSETPGTCPKCGMALVPRKGDQ